MPNRRTRRRGVAAVVAVLALAAITTTVGGSVAYGGARSTLGAKSAQGGAVPQAACPAWYVVTSSTATEVWIDPEPTGFYEIWDKWPRGQVFCALGTNSSGTRYRVEYWCEPDFVYCDPIGPQTAWVSNSSSTVVPLNCTPYMVTRYAYVWKEAEESPSTERWAKWHAGHTFCTFGKNASGSRFKVYHYCGTVNGCQTEQTVIGWVPTDPLYYTPLPPAPVYAPPSQRFTNETDFPINDNTTIESPIAVTGVAGNAPATLKVEVNITHTYIGDLVVTLVAPDGSLYVLHNRAGGNTGNIVTTYTVNASSEVADGTWLLRVSDQANLDVGTLNVWSLVF